MQRTDKGEFIVDLQARLTEAPFVVLADYRGVTSNDVNTFRRNLEKDSLRFEVVKNTLAVKALEGTGKEGLADHFKGMTAVIISGEDAVAAAKSVKQHMDSKRKIQVKAGFFDGDILDPVGVKAVASLPSREELLVMLLRTLQEGPRQVLGVLQAPARDLLYLLKNYETKLADEEVGE